MVQGPSPPSQALAPGTAARNPSQLLYLASSRKRPSVVAVMQIYTVLDSSTSPRPLACSEMAANERFKGRDKVMSWSYPHRLRVKR